MMLQQLKSLAEEMRSVLAKADAMIAELEAQQAEEVVTEEVVEVEEVQVETTPEEEIVNTFNAICTELIKCLDGEKEYNGEITVDSVHNTYEMLDNKYHSELCGTNNRLNKVLTRWHDDAVKLVKAVAKIAKGEANAATEALANATKYAVLLNACDETHENYNMYLNLCEEYNDRYYDIVDEYNAFSSWVDSSVEAGILY